MARKAKTNTLPTYAVCVAEGLSSRRMVQHEDDWDQQERFEHLDRYERRHNRTLRGGRAVRLRLWDERSCTEDTRRDGFVNWSW